MVTHKKLIKRCEDAITAGRLVDGHGSLQFWAGQVLDSLRSAALAPEAAGQDHTLQLLKETFGHFIVKALMDAPCFEACEQMTPLLRDLKDAGVEMPKNGTWSTI